MSYVLIIIDIGEVIPDKMEFDCVLELKKYLDKLAWENSSTIEEYEKACKFIDSGKLKIKGTKIKTNFNLSQL